MTAVRWVVEHPGHEFAAGGWVEYPTEADANTAAGTAATVWALVTPELVRVVEAAQEFREAAASSLGMAVALGTVDRLFAAVDAITRPADPIAAIAAAHPLMIGHLGGIVAASAIDDYPALLAEVTRLTEQATQWMNDALRHATIRDANYADAKRLADEVAALREQLAAAERDRDRLDRELMACPWKDRHDRLAATVGRARAANRRLRARVIASAHLLDVPFTDEPSQSPWTKIKAELNALGAVLGAADAPPVDAGTSEAGTAGSVEHSGSHDTLTQILDTFVQNLATATEIVRRTMLPAKVGPCMDRLDGFGGAVAFCELPHGHAGGHVEGDMSWTPKPPACDRTDPPDDPDATCLHCGRRGREHPAWHATNGETP